MRGRLITICGLIGSGKSTFTNDLSDLIRGISLSEPAGDERNPYLSLYYSDPKRWAFAMQTHLLQQRDAVNQRALEEMHDGRDVVMDSCMWQDMAYAKMLHAQNLMTDNEYRTYLAIAGTMLRRDIHPDVCIFLKVPILECQARIQERMVGDEARLCEDGINQEYLCNLETNILSNIETNPTTVMFPWGDYLPSKDDRMNRIRNLWCLTDDLNTHIVLRN